MPVTLCARLSGSFGLIAAIFPSAKLCDTPERKLSSLWESLF
nr:MAG TPA: hypothetical protein [Bacteriophage sp.]